MSGNFGGFELTSWPTTDRWVDPSYDHSGCVNTQQQQKNQQFYNINNFTKKTEKGKEIDIWQTNEGQNAVLFHPFDRRISLLRKVFSRPNLGRMVLEWQFLEVNEFQFEKPKPFAQSRQR